jgi:hypothetical protein
VLILVVGGGSVLMSVVGVADIGSAGGGGVLMSVVGGGGC